MVQIFKPQEGMSIYDPTAGSGGMLIQSYQYIQEQGGNYENVDLHDIYYIIIGITGL